MSSKIKIQSSKLRKIMFFCSLAAFFVLQSCSIPNLENPECTEARTAVKEFYSFHLGNDMKASPENLQARAKFLTEQLKQTLAAQPAGNFDYFTQTDDYPKTFRAGKCEVAAPEKTEFQVVFFWKDETRTEQREVKVETVKQGDKWLVNKVEK